MLSNNNGVNWAIMKFPTQFAMVQTPMHRARYHKGKISAQYTQTMGLYP